MDFGVVPELVYEALTDADRVDRWLPEPLTLDKHGDGVLRVRLDTPGGPAGRTVEQHILTISARPATDRWFADVIIMSSAAGAHANLLMLPQCPQQQVERLVSRAIRALGDEIQQTFTPG
jgi:hypothetical protein